MGGERRRFLRFPYKMKAELVVQEKVFEVDEISNLGIGGCLLPVYANLESGASCILRIILIEPDKEPIVTVKGTILRSEHEGVAIKFTSINPENLNHLQKIARYNSQDPDRVEREIKEHPGIV